jgi:hypothetical protein
MTTWRVVCELDLPIRISGPLVEHSGYVLQNDGSGIRTSVLSNLKHHVLTHDQSSRYARGRRFSLR